MVNGPLSPVAEEWLRRRAEDKDRVEVSNPSDSDPLVAALERIAVALEKIERKAVTHPDTSASLWFTVCPVCRYRVPDGGTVVPSHVSRIGIGGHCRGSGMEALRTHPLTEGGRDMRWSGGNW